MFEGAEGADGVGLGRRPERIGDRVARRDVGDREDERRREEHRRWDLEQATDEVAQH
jgi:hypothetical protein